MYWISGTLFFPLAFLFVMSFFGTLPNPHSTRNAAIGLAVWAILTGGALLQIRRTKLEITDDGFRYVDLFRDADHRYEDFSGFRVPLNPYGGRSLWGTLGVLYDTAGRMKMRLSGNLERPGQVRDWLRAHFRDLDATDASAESQLLAKVSETAPGSLPAMRALATVLNGASIALVVSLIFSSSIGNLGSTRRLLTMALLLIPWATLLLRARFGQLVAFERTAHPSRLPLMDTSLLLPLIGAGAITSAYPPLRWLRVWPFAIPLALVLFLAVLRLERRFVSSRGLAVFLLLACLGYGYGSISFLNAALDRGSGFEQAWTVRGRSVRKGIASLVVIAPDSAGDARSLTVPRGALDRFQEAQRANVRIRPGALGIAWVAGIEPSR